MRNQLVSCKGAIVSQRQRRYASLASLAAAVSSVTLLAVAFSSPSPSAPGERPQRNLQQRQLRKSGSFEQSGCIQAEPAPAECSRRLALGGSAALASSLVAPLPALAQRERDLNAYSVFRRTSPSVFGITQASQVDTRGLKQGKQIPTLGSGFVWDQDHVITNFHVVAALRDAPVVVMVEKDKKGVVTHRILGASMVGADPLTDIALLRIESELVDEESKTRSDAEIPLKPLQRGTSGSLVVGQDVYALGSPFGLEQSMSRGIVSGLMRKIEGQGGRPISGVIQTDASINPGNSGGPLLDSDGQVVGMNTAAFTSSGVFAGVGLAIPIDTVEKNVARMLKVGYVPRPALGVVFAPDSLLEPFGSQGAMVLKVVKGGPAYQAGLQPMRRGLLGDIIIDCEGRKILSSKDIYDVLEKKEPGDDLAVTLQRSSLNEATDNYETVQATIRLVASPPKVVIT